jgi:hypothetical protein
MSDLKKKVFLKWVEPIDDTEDSGAYWEQFSSLEDAVTSEAEEIYVAEPKLLGRYQRKTVIEKVKQRGRPRK